MNIGNSQGMRTWRIAFDSDIRFFHTIFHNVGSFNLVLFDFSVAVKILSKYLGRDNLEKIFSTKTASVNL